MDYKYLQVFQILIQNYLINYDNQLYPLICGRRYLLLSLSGFDVLVISSSFVQKQ